MKKFISIMTVLFAAIGLTHAYTNVIFLGVNGNIPFEYSATGESPEEIAKFKSKSVGFDLGYIGATDAGFTFKIHATTDFGLISSNSSILASYGDMLNINSLSLVGLGYRIINDEKINFSIFGNIGFNLDNGLYLTSDSTAVTVATSFVCGADATVVFTPSKVFSFYGSVSVNAAWTGIAISIIEPDSSSKPVYTYVTDSPHLLLAPTIGIAWRF